MATEPAHSKADDLLHRHRMAEAMRRERAPRRDLLSSLLFSLWVAFVISAMAASAFWGYVHLAE